MVFVVKLSLLPFRLKYFSLVDFLVDLGWTASFFTSPIMVLHGFDSVTYQLF